MAKGESYEYQAKLLEDNGVVRGRIPAPLIRDLGGKPGDYLIFRTDGTGSVKITLGKARRPAKTIKATGRTSKSAASKRRH
jgi:hypothetical protein